MRIGVDFSQPSTLRGLIMIIGAIFIGIAYLMGKDVAPLLAIIMSASGSAGLFLKDSKGQ